MKERKRHLHWSTKHPLSVVCTEPLTMCVLAFWYRNAPVCMRLRQMLDYKACAPPVVIYSASFLRSSSPWDYQWHCLAISGSSVPPWLSSLPSCLSRPPRFSPNWPLISSGLAMSSYIVAWILATAPSPSLPLHPYLLARWCAHSSLLSCLYAGVLIMCHFRLRLSPFLSICLSRCPWSFDPICTNFLNVLRKSCPLYSFWEGYDCGCHEKLWRGTLQDCKLFLDCWAPDIALSPPPPPQCSRTYY